MIGGQRGRDSLYQDPQGQRRGLSPDRQAGSLGVPLCAPGPRALPAASPVWREALLGPSANSSLEITDGRGQREARAQGCWACSRTTCSSACAVSKDTGVSCSTL